MERWQRALTAAAALAAAIIGGNAWAQASPAEVPIYVGFTFGQSSHSPGCGGLTSCDDNDRALRVLAGYRFSNIFSAEVGFHNLGKSSTVTHNDLKATAWEAVGLAHLPVVGALSAYGKLGIMRGRAKASGVAASAGGTGVFDPNKETNYGATYGIGLQLELTPNLALRGEWQNYPKLGGSTLQRDFDVRVMSAGAIWKFR